MRRFGFVVTALFLLWMLLPRPTPAYPRQTIVIAADPITVVSWNPRDRTLIKILLPSDMQATGTHGYGTYSFEAFWKLGEIDKKDGTVLMESISEALGIPVTGYIGARTGLTGGNYFSVGGLFGFLRGRYRTNLSFNTFLSYVWLMQFSKPNKVTTYDFAGTPAQIAQDVAVPDGSHVFVLSPDQVDNRLAHVFEDERIRKQLITTSVYNTTDVPSLGTRAARLLGNLGVSVVSVGNTVPEVDICTISGTKPSLQSASALVISSVLGCKKIESNDAARADLTVRIGTQYAKRFMAN